MGRFGGVVAAIFILRICPSLPTEACCSVNKKWSVTRYSKDLGDKSVGFGCQWQIWFVRVGILICRSETCGQALLDCDEKHKNTQVWREANIHQQQS